MGGGRPARSGTNNTTFSKRSSPPRAGPPPRASPPPRSAALVAAVRIEGDVVLDLRHRLERGLIRPHRIEGTIPAGRNAVVGRVALVRAIGRMFAARERR